MRFPRTIVAGVLAAAATSVALAAPAQASHLTGGTIAASIDGQGMVAGQLLWYERGTCQVNDVTSVTVQVTDPNSVSKEFDIDLEAFRCTASAEYYRSTFSFDLKDAAGGFGASPSPGRYKVRFSSCCRVGGILNTAGGNVSLEATPRYVPGAKTSSPELLSPVPLGFGIGYGYDADFRPYDPDGAAGVTMALLQGGMPADPFYDVDAPTSQRVTLGNDGHVRMGPAETSAYTAGQYLAYKVRATDADGDATAHDVLVTAANNAPPVIADGPAEPKLVPGETLTIPVLASDPNGNDVVTLQADGMPAWATFTTTPGNPATGEVKLNPPAGTEGVFSFTVDAYDSAGVSLQVTRRITVTVAKPAPVPTPVPAPVVTRVPEPAAAPVVVTRPVPAPGKPKVAFAGLERLVKGLRAGRPATADTKAAAWLYAPGPGRFVADGVATVQVSRGTTAAQVKRLTLFSRTKAVTSRGLVSLNLSLPRKTIKRLAGLGLTRITVEAKFIPASGEASALKRTFDLKRFTMLFLRKAKITGDRKGLRAIARVPYAGRLRATARATHDGRDVALGTSRVLDVKRGEQDIYVRFTAADAQHLVGAGTEDVRLTLVLDRKGGGRQLRTRRFALGELLR